MVALLLAVAAFVVAFGFRKANHNLDGQPVQMTDINNQPVSFADLKGHVVFVNNWASWCPPCIAEMPSIQALKKKLGGNGVKFIMVSFDEDPEKAQAFVTKKGYDFEIFFPGAEYPFVTSSIPATFILDKNGNTVSRHLGMADYNNDEIVKQLKTLANE